MRNVHIDVKFSGFSSVTLQVKAYLTMNKEQDM